MKNVAELLNDYPAAVGPFWRKEHGYTLPEDVSSEFIEISDENIALLTSKGITVIGEYGAGNRVNISHKQHQAKLRIVLTRAFNNTVFVDPEARGNMQIELSGSNHLFVCGRSVINVAATFRSERCALLIGSRCTGASANFWIEGPEYSIQVGDDCMFSWNIYIRTSDGHGVIDLRKRKKINHPASVVIGPHVWVGQDVVINKGVSVGGGSIISAKSVVTKKVDECVSVAGIPAKVIREAVSWTRRADPYDNEMDDLFTWPFVTAATESSDY